jgi:mannose-6-phosphate isomerase-like protein (cupin superfamily)
MITTDLNTIELTEFIAKANPGQRCKATFPLLGAHGTKDIATVYIVIDPDEKLGNHMDSAEEMLLVLEGEVEVTVGSETGRLSKGQLAVVPKMVPHDINNTGGVTARILGFFGGANNIVATFDEVWSPTESNTVDTSLLD